MAKKESSIKSFVLRVDSETMEAIEQWAADEFRSTNSVDNQRGFAKKWPIEENTKRKGDRR